MQYIPVTDLNITELQPYHQLRDRILGKDNSIIADSPKVINKLLETDVQVKSILATREYYEAHQELLAGKEIPKAFLASKELMQDIVGHKIHHNAMMHAIRPETTSLEQLGDHILMLDEISSTENIGAVARSAAALGITSFMLPKQGPHPYSRRALRVSMGYISMLHYHLYENIFETIKKLQNRGYTIIAAEISEHSIPLSQIEAPDKWVLIMGHEGKGLCMDVINACDKTVHIEMASGVKSFNVAVAASILMYQLQHP